MSLNPHAIAITGAQGFIGRHLVQRLAQQGHQLHLLSRRPPNSNDLPNVRWFSGDLTRTATDLREFLAGADLLYHCAGEITDPSRMHELHVSGTQRLIEAANGRIKRWVQLSSVGVYGPQRDGVVDENTLENPVGEYETTKAKSDALVRDAARLGQIELVVLQPSNVFGADMSNQSLRQMVAMIKRGWFFYIGKPGASANYIHVENVVDALMLCGFHSDAAGKCYIVSDFVPLEQMIAGLSEGAGVPEPRLRVSASLARCIATTARWIPRFPLTNARIDAMTSRARYDASRIAQELGYSNSISLKELMREFAAG